MTEKKIIALIGPANSGKTTLARLLSDHGYHRCRFAESLKRMLQTFLMDQGALPETVFQMLDGDLKECPTIYLNNQTPRRAMQTLGTEWRNLIDKNLWVDAWERYIEASPYFAFVVDDMRFPHEAERVRKLGGRIFRLSRPDYNQIETHSSEEEYKHIEYDGTILNNREPEYMLSQLNYLLSGDVP